MGFPGNTISYANKITLFTFFLGDNFFLNFALDLVEGCAEGFRLGLVWMKVVQKA